MCKVNEARSGMPGIVPREADARSANKLGHGRAFWSIDAAFAFVLSVAMFAMFSSMLYSAGISAARGADEASGSLLSARFSSYALANIEKGNAVDLQAVLDGTSRSYASLRTADSSGNGQPVEIGSRTGNIYCTRRIYLHDGRMEKLEACIG